MNYWIFQGNPDVFKVTEYLAGKDEIVWSVRQGHLAQHMKPGDEVFIWRAAGRKKGVSGVVAVAHLTGEPRMMSDEPASHPHWRKGDPTHVELRVELTIEKRCLGSKETIKREWIEADPELKGLRILRLQNETNYRITAAEAKRLAMLCRSVGSDWNREEDVAALWAFKKTEWGSVSKTVGSPVAVVASIIGRPIGGVYNKVMNFRHIDPRDSRAGLPNINQLDREVWAEFYDSSARRLNAHALDTEFKRLWPLGPQPVLRTPTYGDFGEAPNDNPNELANFAAKVRKGQPKFRRILMELYEEKCALSGWGPPEVLEAAHIYPHAESGVNHSRNGLLIRADLHYLMDAGLLRIYPDTLEMQLDEKLGGTAYWELNGQQLRSRRDGSRPSADYLKRRFSGGDDT
jgi:predicted RNA-binding protein with PUA-like domain